MRFLLALLMCVCTAATSFAQPANQGKLHFSTAPAATVHAAQAPAVPNQTPLLAFALVGATAAVGESSGRAIRLMKTYLFNGVTYGPGDAFVPADFPELDDDGDVIHPLGSKARMAKDNQRLREQGGGPLFVSPPSSGGVDTGEQELPANATVSGYTRASLAAMNKTDLTAMAEELEIEVVRADGGEGDPSKADFVNALAMPKVDEPQ